jgi:hypothetical protein
MPSLSPTSLRARLKALENQRIRLQQQLKAASVRKRQGLLNNIKRTNNRVRSAVAKKRAVTAAATRRFNNVIKKEVVNLKNQGYVVKGIKYT